MKSSIPTLATFFDSMSPSFSSMLGGLEESPLLSREDAPTGYPLQPAWTLEGKDRNLN